MMRRTSMLIVMAALFVFPARSWAGKVTTPPPGACQVTLRDAAGDVIRSDNGQPYVNGVGGVVCTVDQDPTSVHYGWLNVQFSSTRSQRSILYLGQAADADGRAGYSGFNSRGTFEVKGMAKIQWNGIADYYDIAPFRANVEIGQFSGDSNFTGASTSTGSSSVFVKPHSDGCTWDVWSDPTAGPFASSLGESTPTRYTPRVIELRQQQGPQWITKGYYAMPFGATVKLIAKPGC